MTINADTLTWQIVHEIYGPTGNLSKLIGRTEFHDRLVPLIEGAMRADANEPTRDITELRAERDVWRRSAELRQQHCVRLEVEVDRLTGALGEMTFGRVTAEDELKAIKNYGGVNDHGVPLPFVLSCRICQSSMWVCAEAYLSADNARRAAQRSRDAIAENLSKVCDEREEVGRDLERASSTINSLSEQRTKLTVELRQVVADRDKMRAEYQNAIADLRRELKEANSERLTDAAITELEQRTADRLSAYIDNAYTRRMMAASICADVRAVRGRTEPPSAQPAERCTVRVSQAHYGQPCGPDACSRPCGNVMPCAEHPATEHGESGACSFCGGGCAHDDCTCCTPNDPATTGTKERT